MSRADGVPVAHGGEDVNGDSIEDTRTPADGLEPLPPKWHGYEYARRKAAELRTALAFATRGDIDNEDIEWLLDEVEWLHQHHPDRPPLADAGSWWVTTGPLPAGGEKRAGPYQTQDRAMAARALLERAEGHERYWVDEETASDPAAAPGLAAPDEALVHLVGEEDEEPACWTTDDAPWDTTAWITHNPLKVTCPAPECNPGRTAPGGVS